MPGDKVDDTTAEVGEPATDGEMDRRRDGTAGGAGGPAVEWLARRLTGETGQVDQPAETWTDAGEQTVDGQHPAQTWADVDEPTGEWPAPEIEEWAEEVTDPAGYAQVYGPPSDPFEEEDEGGEDAGDVLPGWEAPSDQHPSASRRRILVVAGVFLALAGLVGVILLTGRGSAGVERAAGSRNDGAVAAGDQGGVAAGDQRGASGSDLGGASGSDQGGASGSDQGGASGAGQGAPGGSPVSAPVGGRTSATFELVDGAGAVQVRAGDLGDDLYRISTPAGSGVAPKVVDEGGSLRLFLPSGARGGATAVSIQLSTAVRWTVRLHGGANRTQIDLNGAQVDAVDLEGGANRIDLALPAPKARTAVRMSGGVDQFFVRLAGGTPVRVRLQNGAGRVTLAGDTRTGIAPGREFTAFGWTPGGSGVDLTAAAGMSGLTVSLG
jgi:hypothetical protein